MELAQKTEIRQKHTLFYWMFGLMLCMVIARNVLHIGFSVYLLLVPVALIAVFGNKDDIFATALACIPLSTAFQYKYAIIIIIIVYCVRFSREVKITAKVIPIVLMFLWEMLHFGMGEFGWIELFRSFAELAFLAFLFCVSDQKIDLALVSRTIAVSAIVICSCILLVQLEANSYDFSELFTGTLRFGAADEKIENFGLNFNENRLGGICNIAIIGILLVTDKGRMRIFDMAAIGILAVFGTMTMSRTFIICFAIIVIYYFAFQTGTFDKKFFRMLGIVLAIGIGIVILYMIMPQVIENFSKRFMEEDISGGRGELFDFYNKHIFSSPLYTFFGIGLQNFEEKIMLLYSTSINACHNGYQELVVVWGIPGIALFIGLVWSVFSKNAEQPVKRNLLQYGPITYLLIATIAGQFITNGTAILELSFAYLCLKTNFQKEIKQESLHNVTYDEVNL